MSAASASGRRFRFQESGLVVVIIILGALLSLFGGKVTVPKTEVNAQGERQRVFRTNAAGERELVTVEKNKFFNTQSLANLAKDTSFIAIMAVGATFVIISGGIDLSVGAIYALASVLGALTLHIYGPGGIHPEHSGAGVLSGAAVCLGAALLAGLANGAMLVLLRVHPFIVTLGTMAIFRGIAFVITQGQSVGGFPPAFQNAVRWQVGDRLMPVPLLVMMIVAAIGALYLRRLAAGRRIYAIGGNEVA